MGKLKSYKLPCLRDPNIVKTNGNQGILKDKFQKPRHCGKFKKVGLTLQKCPEFNNTHNAKIHIEDSNEEKVWSNSSLNSFIIHFTIIFN